MKKEPLVSVIIPTYNRAKVLPRAINSALKQTYKNIEIIVVDDGSTDDTKEAVKNLQKKSKKIKYFYQKNKGRSPTKNLGILKSSGDYLAFLDDDDYWEKNAIKSLANALIKNKDAALAYCGWQNIGLKPEECNPFIPPDYEKICKMETLLTSCPWPINAALTKKEAILEFKSFDEKLNAAEDYDLWLKIANSNKIVLVKKVLAYYVHKNTKNSISKTNSTDIAAWKVKKKFVKQHPEKVSHIEKEKLKLLIDGELLKAGYNQYWKRNLSFAHKTFRKAFFTGYWKTKDLKYLLPSLLPFAIYKEIIKSIDKTR